MRIRFAASVRSVLKGCVREMVICQNTGALVILFPKGHGLTNRKEVCSGALILDKS